ncbi:hypothetical protein LDENG_00214630, partial [Lucifuga dentata]
MSEVGTRRELANQRFTAAAEEILRLCERKIAKYEEELSRSQQENVRLRKRLNAVFNPKLQLHRADVQQLLEQQERRSSLDQEEPEPSHIKKEEEEEVLISQEGEQLHDLEEADVTKFPPSGPDGEDCGGPEPARNTYPGIHF